MRSRHELVRTWPWLTAKTLAVIGLDPRFFLHLPVRDLLDGLAGNREELEIVANLDGFLGHVSRRCCIEHRIRI